MTKFIVTYRNGETRTSEARYLKKEFTKGWWSYDEDGKEIYEYGDQKIEIPLGDIMYFHVEVSNIYVGEKLTLQLFDYDYFWWMGEEIDEYNIDTNKFNNEKVFKTSKVASVNGKYIATVKLDLDERWNETVHDDHDDKFSLDQTIELYWKVTYENKKTGKKIVQELPYKKDNYLRVGHHNQSLFFKPPVGGHNLPEFLHHDGSPLVFLKNSATKIIGNRIKAKSEAKDRIVGEIHKKIEETVNEIVLAKLEKGNIAMNTGKVYTNPTAKLYNKTLFTNEGKLIEDLKIRKSFGIKEKGTHVTNKGISQYDYFSQNGVRVKALGYMKMMDKTFSFFDLIKFAKDGKIDGSSPLSVPGLAGIGPLGGTLALALDVAGILMQTVKDEWDEALEEVILHDLEVAKSNGLEGIEEFVYGFGDKTNHKLISVSKNTANLMLKGRFQSMQDLRAFDAKEQNSAVITILYRSFVYDDIDRKDIDVVELILCNDKDF